MKKQTINLNVASPLNIPRNIPSFSVFLNEHVKVDTPNGSVQGLLKHIGLIHSHKKGKVYPEGHVVLENSGRLIIVRHWICIKKG